VNLPRRSASGEGGLCPSYGSASRPASGDAFRINPADQVALHFHVFFTLSQ
jgi:hypothetical protein